MAKKISKIKIIYPPMYNPRSIFSFGARHLPLGSAVLCAFMKENGLEAELDDLVSCSPGNRGFKLNERYMDASGIDGYLYGGDESADIDALCSGLIGSSGMLDCGLLGFSVNSAFQYISSLLLAKHVKKVSGIPIVMGGPFITQCLDILKEPFRYTDYFISGKGEEGFLGLARFLSSQAQDIARIPGLAYNLGDKICRNPESGMPIKESLPPDFSGLLLGFYRERSRLIKLLWIPYQTSSGCVNKCSFCVHHLNRLEYKPVEKCVREIKAMKKRYGSMCFRFVDSLINKPGERLEEFCEALIKEKAGIIWQANAAVSVMDDGLLKRMRASGCRNLSFGIEQAADPVISSCAKGFSIGEAEEVIKATARHRIRNTLHFMAGCPYEKGGSIDSSLDFIRRNKGSINQVIINVFRLMYKSPIYLNPGSYGLENLALNHPLKFYYNFDETNGLRWREKEKQQEQHFRRLLDSVRKMGITVMYNEMVIPSGGKL